jgi:hypothetical protein
MKKLALIVVILTFITSCQKKQTKDENEDLIKDSLTKCIDLEDYYSSITVMDKANWLKKYGELVCKDILENAMRLEHKVDTTKITNLHEIGYEIKWKDLKKFVEPNFYNAYLSFVFNSNGDVTSLNLVSNYSQTVPCYSIPFILFVGKEKKLNDECFIEFKIGDLNNKTVLFVIAKDANNNILGYYNCSDSPM